MPEPIVCVCSNCDARLKLKDSTAVGKKIRCPKCQEPFEVVPVAQARSVSNNPSTKASKTSKPKPPPAEDDWLDDLGESDAIDDSEENLPPVVKKKKKATVPQEIRERKRSEEGREMSLPVHYLLMGVTGLLGGLIGASIWAALIYFTGVEIGYVAILVGAAAGIGVRLGASQWDYGMGPGLLAVAVAIVALVGGKVVGGKMYVKAELADMQIEMFAFTHDNYLIADFAEELLEKHPEGQPLSEPEIGEDFEGEFGPEQVPRSYPKEIWDQALERWNGMTEAERQKLRDDRKQILDDEFDIPATALFGPIDALWFFLAIGAAYRIATGDDGD